MLYARQNALCHLCDLPMTTDDSTAETYWTFDHLVPFALGGKSDESNIALAHRRCNLLRGIKDPLLC